ncbi:transcriptional regulator GcvA [Methylobacterium isbiliense]|uniref:Glycine cleavage system transcriptional activator n=1 Tax=Methylobacterium isbiliense TaxID=315478 RepID=A0ABQ4SBS3_9HYPH|nr:transcriptional regulator GcvA [Methylobacterium isbiliense]MDN3623519.1 transcriptional regulator GcvA [Methylobacterium isbiliense]GJD99817.1 Glycine cleavage system transcriptional activator [Methylobacterium isbiliense]
MDPRRLPPLNAVRAFEAAARHPTFQAAGDELGVSAGAVAQQVKALEAWFGLRLFRRLPSRGVVLTPAGERYARAAGQMLDGLAAATAGLKRQSEDDALTVSTTHSFAALWLIPRIGDFRARHPDIDVRIVANNALADFSRDAVDLAIRHGKGGYPGLRADLLLRDAVFPVCSPALRDGEPPLRRPQDLAGHTLLHDGDPLDADMVGWAEWLAAAGVPGVAGRRGPTFTHTFMVLQAATAGQGVALATRVLGGDLLAHGGLVRPFPEEVASPYSFFVVTPDEPDPPKVARFRAWLAAQAGAPVSPL